MERRKSQDLKLGPKRDTGPKRAGADSGNYDQNNSEQKKQTDTAQHNKCFINQPLAPTLWDTSPNTALNTWGRTQRPKTGPRGLGGWRMLTSRRGSTAALLSGLQSWPSVKWKPGASWELEAQTPQNQRGMRLYVSEYVYVHIYIYILYVYYIYVYITYNYIFVLSCNPNTPTKPPGRHES